MLIINGTDGVERPESQIHRSGCTATVKIVAALIDDDRMSSQPGGTVSRIIQILSGGNLSAATIWCRV